MSDPEGKVEGNADAFAPETTPAVQLIVQMRIYDALMGILTHLDAGAASKLYDLHARGKIAGALPFIDISVDEDGNPN